ncbi:hypothetical protein CMI47_08600 [Candidatus Pacearchaeota archaeon]|nr:hypothetical protein [Candidatus Pacearchaeota archaeon]|tara:strand:- start:3510 stop:3959 length:450 start_codon:yes stop_codon:yes gene_type:complete
MWYKNIKIAQDLNVGIPNVTIEGPDRDIVEEALKELQEIDMNVFSEVDKITIDIFGGNSLGHVSSHSPREVVLSIRNVENVINKKYPNLPRSKNDNEYRSRLKEEIKRVLMHELGHVTTYNPETNTFEGHELPAERSEQEAADKGYYQG